MWWRGGMMGLVAGLALWPVGGQAGSGADDVAKAVLAQMAAGLPGLVRANQNLADVVDARLLGEIGTVSLDDYDDLARRLPAPPDGDLEDELNDVGFGKSDVDGPATMFWLKAARLGAVDVTEGTADCDYFAFFTVRGGRSTAVAAPAVLSRGACAAGGESDGLYRVGNDVAAVSVASPEDDDMDGGGKPPAVLNVGVQVWDGAAWTAPEALRAVLDYPLQAKPAYAYCPDGEDCAGAVRLGFAMARKFDGWGSGNFVPVKILPTDETKYRKMLALSQTEDTENLPAADDAQGETVDWDFGGASTVFAAYLDGELVLGRIGHGQMAWRENNAWDVGFWALDDDGTDLDEVAGLIFERGGPVLETVTLGGTWVAAGE